MRPSFVRMVLGSVLFFWAVSFFVLVVYARSRSWTEDRARADGVFLLFEVLDEQPRSQRAVRLRELQTNSRVRFSLISPEEVERRVGRRVEPGRWIHHATSARAHWYYLVFADGLGALAAGPVNPAIPSGFVPIGLILAVTLLPVIAGLIALRVERGIVKVERASRTLATGDLSARVGGTGRPSDELAASFNEMAERIERLVRGRHELVQAVSHEIGAPLSRLRFHVELLGSEITEQHQQRLAAMTGELDELEKLAAELLGYVQSDDLKLDMREFPPHKILVDLVELAKLEVSDDRIVQVDLKLPEGFFVAADPRLFQRAVENLLRNATCHARGKVILEAIPGEGDLRVAVHDDGPGIPEHLRDKVFAPFYRTQSDRSRRTGGVGLGLAIVHRIVQRHGGHVVIGDSPLGGAAVTTVWPRAHRN